MRSVFRALALVSVFVCAPLSFAVTYTINFDSFTPGEYPAPDFLSAYGIANIAVGGAASAGPPLIQDHTNVNSIIPSPPNVFTQSGTSNDPGQLHRLTFTFDPGLLSFGFTRIGKHSFGSTDTWSTKFYDSNNLLIGGWAEGPLVNAPPKPYSISAPSGETISKMELDSIWTGFATHRNIPVDDFVLVFVPEPASCILLPIGCVGLALGRRWRRAA